MLHSSTLDAKGQKLYVIVSLTKDELAVAVIDLATMTMTKTVAESAPDDVVRFNLKCVECLRPLRCLLLFYLYFFFFLFFSWGRGAGGRLRKPTTFLSVNDTHMCACVCIFMMHSFLFLVLQMKTKLKQRSTALFGTALAKPWQACLSHLQPVLQAWCFVALTLQQGNGALRQSPRSK